MIDWARVIIPFEHSPLNSGEVVSVDETGVIEWRSPKLKLAVGSYDKRIAIKSIGGDGQGGATHLWINGNPSKFLQGHNVFGSDDLVSLMFDTFKLICRQFDFHPTIQEYNNVRRGNYDLKTVDINYSLELQTRADVLAVIRAYEKKAKTRHGRPSMKGGTLYFGKQSERWAIKFYSKAEEIQTKNGALPERLKNIGIDTWAENKLRIELRIQSKELVKLSIQKASDLTPDSVSKLFNEYLERIQMTEQIKLPTSTANGLPTNLKSTYTLWSGGYDLRSMLPKTTYYRQRKLLLQYGINIDIQPCKVEESNVIPMLRIIEAVPATIPKWAFTKGVIHHSAVCN